MPTNLVPIRNALFSVYDKDGLEPLTRGLYEVNPDLTILSTGGTLGKLRSLFPGNERILDLEVYTGAPQSPDHLVVTLHPKVHAGLLMDWENPKHIAYSVRNGVYPIDLVVNNLYPFEEVVASGANPREARDKIDIGGVTLIRAAAKNAKRVAILTDPSQYDPLLGELRAQDGATTFALRRQLRNAAFKRTSEYDAAIDRFYDQLGLEEEAAALGIDV
ncbi:MAG: hypothetical protein HY369_03450 [Candidatus Aenigmarchaeota archaeon]|nr:hypothetical protein [Candidatus Aenigmarchaeota archaeon]